MKLKSALPSLFTARLLQLAWTFFLLVWAGVCEGQEIIWAKLYPLEKTDEISCITKDEWGDMYAGGYTRRNVVGGSLGNAIVYKLAGNGDTLYSQYLNIKGDARSIVIDFEGRVRIGVRQYDTGISSYNSILVRMSSEGFIFQRDTIYKNLIIHSSIIGKDSSWILVGQTPNMVTGGWWDMFFQRVQKDGTIDPLVTMNPNHPDCIANRVEQLPNGHYLVSGTVGSRIASYELDELGLNPVFRQWYQTPNLSYLYDGVIGQAQGKNVVFGSNGSPALVGLFDSLGTRLWMKKDTGIQIAPQAMSDGSILVGYSQRPIIPHHTFARFGADSSTIWFLNLEDSLSARGLQGNLKLKAYTFFEDQSAVVAATLQRGTVVPYTNEDPFFIKIANVGTPVTALTKPKRGTLSNETLAPWPNPSGGTLYLKQHFDKAEVHFYTVSGREVQTDTVRFGQPINISTFAPGLYLYRAVIDGKPFSGKVFKN